MRLQKFISTALSVTTALTLVGLGAPQALAAGRLQQAQVNMSVVRSGQTSNHTISFRAASTTDIHKVVFQYRQTASLNTQVPVNLGLGSSTKGLVIAKNATDSSNWTLDTTDAANGNLTYTATTDTTGITGGELFSFETQNITNNTTTTSNGVTNPLCDSITDSDTCWVRITTYKADNSVIDTSTTTYTVINPITVTATVDPILTFTISAVPAGSQPDASMGQAADATSDAVTLPFGNLTLGTARVVAQRLNVLTNANNGYTVYNKFVGRNADGSEGGTELMTGTYNGNNIDPFPANGTGWLTESGGTAKAWGTPSGSTKNVDTGWLGMRTNNSGNNVGTNFSTNDTWAPPYVGSGNGHIVMYSSIPDNGTVGTIVSYKMQANAFQPADLYTGVTVYNVLASY